jgi:CheY-like chemotaxis protein/two-component sensor histidine kinase
MEALGTLAGGIAHDFNNILTIIIGFCELSKLKIDMGRQGEIRKELDEIMKAGIRARDLIRQILTFSRQSGIHREPMDIIPLVKESIQFLRASLPSSIDIRQTIPESQCIVNADATQIHQILMNICSNAAHAMKMKDGVLDILIETVTLENNQDLKGLPQGMYIRITLSDNGVGIPQDIVPRIFEPFFTTKERGKGTGMGLAVVHGIVSDMGGTISVNSTPGTGTTFVILLPVSSEPAITDQAPPSVFPMNNARILLVDDEEAVLRAGSCILEQFGYDVAAFLNPIDALEKFTDDSGSFDLVLTDLTMPKMTGLELSKALKKIRPDIPVILCTGYGLDIKPSDLIECGIAEMVIKPMIPGELAEILNRILSAAPSES